MIRFACVALLLLLAVPCMTAFAEPPVQAPAGYEAKLASLPAPSEKGAYRFDGQFSAGPITGTAVIEAKVAKVAGVDGWATRSHLVAAGKIIEVEETALFDAKLRPVSGTYKESTPDGTKHFTWRAIEGGVELTDKMGDGSVKALAHKGRFLSNLGSLLLFCRLIGQAEGSWKTALLDIDDGKFVEATWTTGKSGPWSGVASKLVNGDRSDGKTLQAGFDAASGALLGVKLGEGGQTRIEMKLPDAKMPRSTPAPTTGPTGPGPTLEGPSTGQPPKTEKKGFYNEPAKTAQQAAAQAVLSFAVADLELLDRVTHWPSVAKIMAAENPAQAMEADDLKSLLMAQFKLSLKPQGERSQIAPVLQAMAPTFKTEKGKHEGTTVVDFGAMFKNVRITVAQIGRAWYLVKFPDPPGEK